MPCSIKTLVGYLILLLWLVSVVFAFWWFEYRYWQTFSPQTVVFESSSLHELYGRLNTQSGEPLVVHFSQPDCPCHRYQLTHIDNLQNNMAGFQQVEIAMNDPIATTVEIPASPAVAIWNQRGEIAYFGPYSSGALCGRGTDFVTRVMNEIRADRNPQWINTLGIGCYCDWV